MPIILEWVIYFLEQKYNTLLLAVALKVSVYKNGLIFANLSSWDFLMMFKFISLRIITVNVMGIKSNLSNDSKNFFLAN